MNQHLKSPKIKTKYYLIQLTLFWNGLILIKCNKVYLLVLIEELIPDLAKAFQGSNEGLFTVYVASNYKIMHKGEIP